MTTAKVTGKDPQAWFDSLGSANREIAAEARHAIRLLAPRLREEVKWGMPWYSGKAYVLCLMATGQRVNLGFWRGVDLVDSKGLLEGSGKGMRHVKMKSKEDVRSPAVKSLIRQAVALDRT